MQGPELHQGYDASLIEPSSIEVKDIIKVLCDECKCVPFDPLRDYTTNKIYCHNYFIDFVKKYKTSPLNVQIKNGG